MVMLLPQYHYRFITYGFMYVALFAVPLPLYLGQRLVRQLFPLTIQLSYDHTMEDGTSLQSGLQFINHSPGIIQKHTTAEDINVTKLEAELAHSQTMVHIGNASAVQDEQLSNSYIADSPIWSFMKTSNTVLGKEDDILKVITCYERDIHTYFHGNSVDFSQCDEYKNCKLTSVIADKSRILPLEADAVLILGTQLKHLSPPPRRDEDQLFVFVEWEAQNLENKFMNSTATLKLWQSLFNWTMTYRLDSDIPLLYGSIKRRTCIMPVHDKDYRSIFQRKTKHIAWLVSHCRTSSRREDYVKQLKTVTDIVIYGSCEPKRVCPKHNKECIGKIINDFMFYLAFENTFHTDYITEKLFYWFMRDIILVVRGGDHYKHHVPNGTVVDANDFKSPEELGEFLNQLGRDENLYIEYLKQKDGFYVDGAIIQRQKTYCNLCKWLHTLKSHRKTYDHIGVWWTRGYHNFKPHDMW